MAKIFLPLGNPGGGKKSESSSKKRPKKLTEKQKETIQIIAEKVSRHYAGLVDKVQEEQRRQYEEETAAMDRQIQENRAALCKEIEDQKTKEREAGINPHDFRFLHDIISSLVGKKVTDSLFKYHLLFELSPPTEQKDFDTRLEKYKNDCTFTQLHFYGFIKDEILLGKVDSLDTPNLEDLWILRLVPESVALWLDRKKYFLVPKVEIIKKEQELLESQGDSLGKPEPEAQEEGKEATKSGRIDNREQAPEELIRGLKVWCEEGSNIIFQWPGEILKEYSANSLGFQSQNTKEWRTFISLIKSENHIFSYGKNKDADKKLYKSIEGKIKAFIEREFKINFPDGFTLYENVASHKQQKNEFKLIFQVKKRILDKILDYKNYDLIATKAEIIRIVKDEDCNVPAENYKRIVTRAKKLGMKDDEIEMLFKTPYDFTPHEE